MKIIRLALLLIFCFGFSQNNNQLWKGYFSYNEIIDIDGSNAHIYAGTQNALFSKSSQYQAITLYNSVNGFKPDNISAVHFSSAFNKIFAGNRNGLINIINSDKSISNKVDIITEVPVAPNIKKVNDFYEYNDKLYTSCDYGISVINVSNSEFISTYFIGTNGEETQVLQTTVLNDEIFAVTRNYGIRKANLNNPNLFDYSQWQTLNTANWDGIVTFNNTIIASNTNGRTYRLQGNSFIEILNHNQPIKKLKVSNDYLVITTQNHVYVLDTSFNVIAHIQQIPEYNVTFSVATVLDNILYVGTTQNGLFSATLSNLSQFTNITPDGPLKNNIFRVRKAPLKLWAVYGDHDPYYNPFPLDYYGISHFSENGWQHIPYEELLEVKTICDIAPHPTKANEIYFTSYFSGVLKYDGEVFTLFNHLNTGTNGLESLSNTSADVRINSPAFDKNNNLWLTNAFVLKAVKTLRADNQWVSYDISDVVQQAQYGRYGPMAIDKNSTKWIPTLENGLLTFNENYSNKKIIINEENGNLPANEVKCVAVDNRSQVWIGTAKGLRIIAADKFINETSLTTNAIIIQEGELAQELFYQQFILDICVDGSNRKWVSIANGGVFLVSANGQETIYNFTKDNSPLPSNIINDIEIDGATGEVFFVTDKGMVSFMGVSTKPSTDLSQVFVYPNPVRPNYSGTVKISSLTDKATIKITDIEGNLVFETTSQGGTIEWDTSAFGSHKVASGVYMVFVSTEDATETTVKKVMIIR